MYIVSGSAAKRSSVLIIREEVIGLLSCKIFNITLCDLAVVITNNTALAFAASYKETKYDTQSTTKYDTFYNYPFDNTHAMWQALNRNFKVSSYPIEQSCTAH